MKPFFPTAVVLLGLAFATPAAAILDVGAQAPQFAAAGAQGGTAVTVDLAELLKKGPVVIFFIPYVFNNGSAAECRAFADNIDQFRAAGATVVGMSRDPVDTLARFSTDECAGKFPMAYASPEVVAGFDVNDNSNFTTRTTFVVAPNSRIAFVHDNDDYSGHVQITLAFVQGMKR